MLPGFSNFSDTSEAFEACACVSGTGSSSGRPFKNGLVFGIDRLLPPCRCMACEMPGSQGELMATSLEELSMNKCKIPGGQNCSTKARPIF
jgi:Na+-translocating ferredoxin:NAD+ oxidoreductase RNF subunit RnfB